MNESEAKTKWCPMVRYSSAMENGIIAIRLNRPTDHTNCIASACMMWWWDSTIVDYKPSGEPIVERSATDGYCGLAGKS